jgi:hypothetical protein
MGVEPKSCKECGKLFLGFGDLCPECKAKEEEDYRKVKDFLRKYPKSSIEVIEEATGVPEKKIRKFVQEGRLQGVSVEAISRCEICGKPITSGRFCPICAEKMAKQFKEASKIEKGPAFYSKDIYEKLKGDG